MGTTTTNYNLYKPDIGETGWGALRNSSYDTIDSTMFATAAHASSDGSSHLFIDQDVTSGSSPTFDGTNITGISVLAAAISIADAGGYYTATDVEGALQENRPLIDANTAKVTNATHSGDATGDTALTAQPALITGKGAATVAAGDLVLMSDVDDTNILKQVTAQSIANLAPGGVELNNLEVVTTGIATTEIPIGTAADTVVYAPLSGGATMANDGAVTIVTNANLTGDVTSVGNATTTVTNANLTGDVTSVGNATTTVTNANLTGIVTSVGNATAIADKALAIAKLADGTDGELITWDGAGVVDTVGAGTVDQVLTSNGAGNAPTFQDAGGGGGITDELVVVRQAADYTWTIGSTQSEETAYIGDTEDIDVGGNWSGTTYTVPSDGYYQASFTGEMVTTFVPATRDGQQTLRAEIVCNNGNNLRMATGIYGYSTSTIKNEQPVPISGTVVWNLVTGNTIRFYIYAYSGQNGGYNGRIEGGTTGFRGVITKIG